MSNRKFIDLFCGIGGFHKGLGKMKCVLACDKDKYCRETYKNNFNVEPFVYINFLKMQMNPNQIPLFLLLLVLLQGVSFLLIHSILYTNL